MKDQLNIVFSVVLILIGSDYLIASNSFVNPDTIKLTDSVKHKQKDTLKAKPNLFLNVSTGFITNKTFGNHPIINVALGLRKKTNCFNLVYEYRFGNSVNNYQTMDNDTLKTVNYYNANYLGFEYQKQIFRNISHEFYSTAAVGAEWIIIHKNEIISKNKIIGGFAMNIGLGYAFYIRKKHGPNIELLYHYANIANGKGTRINPSSFLVRLSYHFRNNYK
jgi:hypothetical protein